MSQVDVLILTALTHELTGLRAVAGLTWTEAFTDKEYPYYTATHEGLNLAAAWAGAMRRRYGVGKGAPPLPYSKSLEHW